VGSPPTSILTRRTTAQRGRSSFERGIAVRMPRDLEDRIEHPLFGWRSPARAVSSQVNDESLVMRIQVRCPQLPLHRATSSPAPNAGSRPSSCPPPVAKVPHHGSRSSSSPGVRRGTRRRMGGRLVRAREPVPPPRRSRP
jgi:hypothetical protein